MAAYPEYTKQDIDQMLRAIPHRPGCIICGQAPTYRIIPRDTIPLTAEIQDKGYLCQYCVDMKYLDPAQYGLRPLKRG